VLSSTFPVLVPAPEVMLPGDLSMPAPPKGVVLFAHGSGSSRILEKSSKLEIPFSMTGITNASTDEEGPKQCSYEHAGVGIHW
jgi:hypothetical protein